MPMWPWYCTKGIFSIQDMTLHDEQSRIRRMLWQYVCRKLTKAASPKVRAIETNEGIFRSVLDNTSTPLVETANQLVFQGVV